MGGATHLSSGKPLKLPHFCALPAAFAETSSRVNNCTWNVKLNAALDQGIELLDGGGWDPVALSGDRMVVNLNRSQQDIHAVLRLTLDAAACQHGLSKNLIQSSLITLALRFEPSQDIGIDADGG